MWNDMFRRWVDLLFWWAPRSETRQPEQPAPEQPAPESPAPEAGGRAAGPEPDTAPQGPPDDLTVIKGIGPAVQEKLRGLGIATFSDLARADPKTLTEQLKGSQPISEARVRDWTEAARERAGI